MSDNWHGRQYRGKATGAMYTTLGEPFEWLGVRRIAYAATSGPSIFTARLREFEGDSLFERITFPKFKVGQAIEIGSLPFRVVAVASEPDRDGDFSYLVKDTGGDVEAAWESDMKAVV